MRENQSGKLQTILEESESVSEIESVHSQQSNQAAGSLHDLPETMDSLRNENTALVRDNEQLSRHLAEVQTSWNKMRAEARSEADQLRKELMKMQLALDKSQADNAALNAEMTAPQKSVARQPDQLQLQQALERETAKAAQYEFQLQKAYSTLKEQAQDIQKKDIKLTMNSQELQSARSSWKEIQQLKALLEQERQSRQHTERELLQQQQAYGESQARLLESEEYEQHIDSLQAELKQERQTRMQTEEQFQQLQVTLKEDRRRCQNDMDRVKADLLEETRLKRGAEHEIQRQEQANRQFQRRITQLERHVTDQGAKMEQEQLARRKAEDDVTQLQRENTQLIADIETDRQQSMAAEVASHAHSNPEYSAAPQLPSRASTPVLSQRPSLPLAGNQGYDMYVNPQHQPAEPDPVQSAWQKSPQQAQPASAHPAWQLPSQLAQQVPVQPMWQPSHQPAQTAPVQSAWPPPPQSSFAQPPPPAIWPPSQVPQHQMYPPPGYFPSTPTHGHHMNVSSQSSPRKKGPHVPLPRQQTYDGTTSWESFITGFRQMSDHCEWDESERVFRLNQALTGEANDFLHSQVPAEIKSDFERLVEALSQRYRERKSTDTYLNEFQNRRLQPKESPARYIADLTKLAMKAYSTADPQTREHIILGQFKSGIDPDARLWVDMGRPANVEEARSIYERYLSNLGNKASSGRGHTRAVHVDSSEDEASVNQKLDQLQEGLTTVAAALNRPNYGMQNRDQQRPPTDPSDRRCYNCNEPGHLIAGCPHRRQDGYQRGSPQYPMNRNQRPYQNQQYSYPSQAVQPPMATPEKREAGTSTEQQGN